MHDASFAIEGMQKGKATKPRSTSVLGPMSPALTLVLFVTILPLLLTLRYSFDRYDATELMQAAFTLTNYVTFATEPFFRGVLLTTLAVAAATAVLCTLLGMPVAYMLARMGTDRGKTVLLLLVIIPLLVGNAARTVGWSVILSDSGILNYVLLSSHVTHEPLRMMYTAGAVVAGLVSLLLPYAIISMQSVLEGIPESLEQAALSLGAGPFVVARRILLPLAMPGIYTGAAVCFILAMSAYAAPVLLGGPSFQMMAPTIYQQITQVSNWPFGAALAFVLMGVTLILTVLSNLFLQRRYGRL